MFCGRSPPASQSSHAAQAWNSGHPHPFHACQCPLGCDSVAPGYQALQVHPGPWLGHAGGMAGFPVQRPAGLPHWAEVRWDGP